jgi:hypothetical protein
MGTVYPNPSVAEKRRQKMQKTSSKNGPRQGRQFRVRMHHRHQAEPIRIKLSPLSRQADAGILRRDL